MYKREVRTYQFVSNRIIMFFFLNSVSVKMSVVDGYINLKLNLDSILLTDVHLMSQIVTFLYVLLKL